MADSLFENFQTESRPKRFAPTLRRILKAAVGFGLFFYLLWKFDPRNVAAVLINFKVSALFLLNLTSLAGFFLSGLGLAALGRALNQELGYWDGVKGVLAAASLSLFIPGRVGDLALPFYWKKHLDCGKCVTLVFMDKMIILFCLFSTVAVSAQFVFANSAMIVISVAGIFGLLSTMALFYVDSSRALIASLVPSKILNLLEGSATASRTLAKEGKKRIFFRFLLCFLRIFVNGLGFWISLWGVAQQTSFWHAAMLMPVAQLLSLLPISIMGIGTVEAVCIYAMGQVEVPAASVLAALVVGRLVNFIWLGVFFMAFNFRETMAKT